MISNWGSTCGYLSEIVYVLGQLSFYTTQCLHILIGVAFNLLHAWFIFAKLLNSLAFNHIYIFKGLLQKINLGYIQNTCTCNTGTYLFLDIV